MIFPVPRSASWITVASGISLLPLQCRPSRSPPPPGWHSGFLICPRVSANWLRGSSLLSFTLVMHTDGLGTPFSSRLHCPHPASDGKHSGSSLSLAGLVSCLGLNPKTYFPRFFRTTLSFRVIDKLLVPNQSSIPHTRQTNRYSVDSGRSFGTLFWSPS